MNYDNSEICEAVSVLADVQCLALLPYAEIKHHFKISYYLPILFVQHLMPIYLQLLL